MEERLIEKMRDMQTEVLHAFHNWARPSEIKSRSHGANIVGLEERVSLLEERLNVGRTPQRDQPRPETPVMVCGPLLYFRMEFAALRP